MKSKIVLGLSIAILLQFIVLTGMVGVAALPLWTGTEVKIKTIPIDPRSLFRGNYARLRYEISQVDTSTDKMVRNGEIIYVLLIQSEDGLYEFSKAQWIKPEQGIYLRGHVINHRLFTQDSSFEVKYGIEAFFAPKEKALELEANLRDEGVAILMVSKNGKARIKDIVSNKQSNHSLP